MKRSQTDSNRSSHRTWTEPYQAIPRTWTKPNPSSEGSFSSLNHNASRLCLIGPCFNAHRGLSQLDQVCIVKPLLITAAVCCPSQKPRLMKTLKARKWQIELHTVYSSVLLCNQTFPSKSPIFNSNMRAILLYASECLTITQRMLDTVQVFMLTNDRYHTGRTE